MITICHVVKSKLEQEDIGHMETERDEFTTGDV